MTGKRPESSSAEGPTGAGAGAPEAAERERYGPLKVARHRKDDGRALILYSHADEETP